MLGAAVLAAYGSLLVLVAYVLLFGQTSFHRGGLVGRLHISLTQGIPSACLRILKALGGDRAAAWLGRAQDYCCWKPNPFVQIFFLSMVIPAYLAFLHDGEPLLDVRQSGVAHWHLYVVHLVVAAALGSFVGASWSDPGVITKVNQKRFASAFRADGVLYPLKPKKCPTCDLLRPARSKHCRVCNVCVSKLDHHCPWINNDVGELNMRWFLLFLVCTAVMCTYGSWLCSKITWGFLRVHGLLEYGVGYKDELGVFHELTWMMRWGYVVRKCGLVCPLALFLAMVAVVMWGFTSFQLYHVARGTTTAETFKWEDIREDRLSQQAREEHEHAESSSQAIPATKGRKKPKSAEAVLVNMYNRGPLRNLIDVLFPPSTRA